MEPVDDMDELSEEQEEIIALMTAALRAVTADGNRKRRRGQKVSWKVDRGHEGAIFSHVTKWKRGELVDPDSGVHPMIHAGWRCLAIGLQEMHPEWKEGT